MAAILPGAARAQPGAGADGGAGLANAPEPVASQYAKPAPVRTFHNYLFEALGPFPIASSALMAGIHQATRTPPEWREGIPGYGERFASGFGISAIDVTTRYSLAVALKEDTLFYPCRCSGVWPRLRHAVIDSAVARRGTMGHKVFSFPAVLAPYAGPMVAVYAWYPRRYSWKDGFRMGNYGLLSYMGENVALEFLPSLLHPERHAWMRRLHLEIRHAGG